MSELHEQGEGLVRHEVLRQVHVQVPDGACQGARPLGVGGEPVRQQFAAVKTPIVSFSFTDDEFMSEKNTASIHNFFINAERKMKRFSPKDFGVKRIGHFGFFRHRFNGSLWQQHVLPALAE